MNPTFLNEFRLVLGWRPRVALEALYWRLTRRRVRARNVLRAALADAPFAYQAWLTIHEADGPAGGTQAWRSNAGQPHPLFSVVILAAGDADLAALARSVESVREQTYRHFEIVVAGARPPAGLGNDLVVMDRDAEEGAGSDAVLLASAVKVCRGTHVMPLTAGNRLARNALHWLAEAIEDHPGAKVIYADHDRIGADGRRADPWLKPRWNLDQALTQDFISPAVVFDRESVRGWHPQPGAGPAAYALALDLVGTGSAAEPPVHCPRVAVHCLRHPDQLASRPQRKAALARIFDSTGALPGDGQFGAIDVVWPLPARPPLVSIVVPTRDKVELLEPCLSSVLELTDYPDFEIIVVDNASTDPAALSYLESIAKHPRVRVIADDRPYNFAALNNAAFRQCKGSVLCMLNNDTKVRTPGWLTAMVRQAVRPNVGAVGAKLLYDDETLQHAGVVIGMGNAAGHAHRKQANSDPGYFLQVHIQRRATAVTAACLVIERSKFDAVGGLDEEHFAVAFNDVDLCLKLDAAGLTNIYEPGAVLWHYESKSRGSDSAPHRKEAFGRELAVLQQRWGTATWIDALHHPGLDRLGEVYRLGFDEPFGT